MNYPKKDFQTDDRNIALYVAYLAKLKEYGDKAKYMSKAFMISEIVPPFFISESRARVIINTMLKKDLNVTHLNKQGMSKNIIETILNKNFGQAGNSQNN